MGSLEIALLGMACAIFFGALIALVTICSIKYKRFGIPKISFISQPFLQHFFFLDRGLLKAYPAPLAIPLPSYQMGMDSSGGRGLSPAGAPSGSVGPPLSILHHGDPRRQSTKSHHSSTQQARHFVN